MARNLVSAGLLVILTGCGNYPLVINRDVIVNGQVSVTEDVHVGDDLDVGDDLTAGTVTVAGDGDFGTVTTGVLAVEDEATIEGDLTVIGGINHVGEIVQIPPPPPPSPVAPVCGNGFLELGEQCDGINLGGQTCLAYGFDGGVLACLNDCTVNFGQCTITLPPPPPPNPALLTAALRSDNGRDRFKIGEDIKLTVFASGGKAPYDFRCLWVDGSFSVKNDSSEPKFPLKVINSPGAGVVTCRVTSDDGQQTDAALTIYVE